MEKFAVLDIGIVYLNKKRIKEAIILSVDLCLKRDGKVNVSYGDILKTLENKGAQHPYTPERCF